jgi:hypothetical protein
MMNNIKNKKNKILDISIDNAATLGRPSNPAISAITKNISAQDNMITSLFLSDIPLHHKCQQIFIIFFQTANYTVPTGIYANECINILIKKCHVKNFEVETGSSAAIQPTSTISSEVSHCYVSDLLGAEG